MAFKKKTWVDRMVEYAGRRKITNVTTMAAQIVDVERAEGVVSEEGTAINAVNMNDFEQRTADAFSAVQQDIEGINSDLGGNRFGFTSDGQPGYLRSGGISERASGENYGTEPPSDPCHFPCGNVVRGDASGPKGVRVSTGAVPASTAA